MANKIRYGLRNVYYALFTEDEAGKVTYQTPKAYKGAVSLTLDAESGDVAKFYADDSIYWQGAGANNGYSGSLEMASGDAKDEFDVDVMGYSKDSHGNIYENSDAEIKGFALLWEFQGDQSATRYVAYNCLASRHGLSGSTKEEEIEPATDSYDLTVSPATDTRHVQLKCPKSSSDYETFFDAVVLPTETVSTSTKSTKAAA